MITGGVFCDEKLKITQARQNRQCTDTDNMYRSGENPLSLNYQTQKLWDIMFIYKGIEHSSSIWGKDNN